MIKEQSIVVSSTLLSNETGKMINTTGSRVTLQFDKPIMLDDNTYNEVYLNTANIPFCEANVTTKNKFRWCYDDGQTAYNLLTFYDDNLPVGIYNLKDINDYITLRTKTRTGSKCFNFAPNEYNSTIQTQFLIANYYIVLTNDSIMSMLGYSLIDTFKVTQNGNTYYRIGFGGAVSDTSVVNGDSVCNLDTLQSIMVRCSICNGTYFNSQSSSDVIANIPINVSTFSQLQYEPNNPIKCSVRDSVKRIDSLTITLCSQDNDELDFTQMNSISRQTWNLVICLKSTPKLKSL